MRLALAAILAIGLTGCGDVSWNGDDSPGIVGTGSGNQRSYAADGFTNVALAGPDSVEVRVGPAFSVRADGGPAALAALRVRRQGATLLIDHRPGSGGTDTAAHVVVTLPVLTEASLAGSGSMAIDRIAGERFQANAAGSGDLSIARLATQRTDLNLAGSSSVQAVGAAGALHVAMAGSGDVTAPQLTATRASVSIAGSGSVRAAVDGEADVQIMGSGNVDLGPRARCSVSRMGSGTVTCGSGGGTGGAE